MLKIEHTRTRRVLKTNISLERNLNSKTRDDEYVILQLLKNNKINQPFDGYNLTIIRSSLVELVLSQNVCQNMFPAHSYSLEIIFLKDHEANVQLVEF